MNQEKGKFKQHSIHDYLELGTRVWILEFEIGDFGASIAKLFELPQEIYDSRKKSFFWTFIKSFLQTCEIGFIIRQSNPRNSEYDTIELTLLGYWETKRYAIPLWILKDLLLGFEVISVDYFQILDSEPLIWNHRNFLTIDWNYSLKNTEPTRIVYDDELFQGQKIYFKLEGNHIKISRYFNEVEFFDRIARTIIPEIDELNDT
ncbi:MAG: hypothetical protein ACFFB2_00765 [Promethearchaeota archaeon]